MGKRVRALFRSIRAVAILLPLIVTLTRDGKRYVLFGGPRRLDEEQHRERARRLTDSFERLGITYIKLAQFLTTRPDFVPPIYLEELSRLQDDVEPESFAEIRTVLEEELGPMEEVFDFFEEEPLSGASIGQVHRAGIDGEEVAVKVRRPGIVAEMEADMVVLSKLIPVVVWGLRRLGQESHAESAAGITSELDRTIRQEMDFERERGVMDEIRGRVEADGLDDRVVIPDSYPAYSTERVLTMSYERGVKITDLETIEEMGHDIEEIVDVIVDVYLRMPFVYECFQADPHHGNLAVNEDGQAIIYDFGISQRPDGHVVDAFVRFFTGLGMQNADVAVDALIDVGAMDPAMDREALTAVVDGIIADISGGNMTEARMDEIQATVDRTLYDYPLKLNQEIVLAMRTTFGVEGLCAKVAPEYDFSAKLAQFFVEQDLFETGVEEYEEERTPAVNVEAIKREVAVAAKKNGKRTVLSVFGATMFLTGVITFSAGFDPYVPAAFGLVGAGSFLSAARSFGEKSSGVTGPAYATRYNMDRWDESVSGDAASASATEPVAQEQSPDAVTDPSA